MRTLSTRAQVLTKRTYNRPGENWHDTITRVMDHQRWLWERALGRDLHSMELMELAQLHSRLVERKVMVAGRTLWLGGTDLVKSRESACFNCAFTKFETVNDLVDIFWLLLQGCGVGFEPIKGSLWGFRNYVPIIQIIRSNRTEKGGNEHNIEKIENGVYYLQIGDSATAWAKGIGKLIVMNYKVNKIVVDLSQIRPAGSILKGYGWISSGDSALSAAIRALIEIRNNKSERILDNIDMLDIVNHLGTVLSSRRSAEICTYPYGGDNWLNFAKAKPYKYYEQGLAHRGQSNNTVVYYNTPSRNLIDEHFQLMNSCGGGDPGIANGAAALLRAPWFAGFNPCVEVLLANKGFCNLVTLDVAKYKNRMSEMLFDLRLIARANYRQTLVNLNDEILQPTWHQNNEWLRLCGVSLTGLVRRPDLTPYDFKMMKNTAVSGCYEMARELGTQIPRNVTLIKPEGTISKIMDTTEGHTRPAGRYIFNNVNFSIHDPMVDKLKAAGYKSFMNPHDSQSILITLPAPAWEDVQFGNVNGVDVDTEPAVEQLNRYQILMNNYVEQNVSCTISYEQEEIPQIVDWVHKNWNNGFVACAFLRRQNPLQTAEELGYAYLPQQVTTKEEYYTYCSALSPVIVDSDDVGEEHQIEALKDCGSGGCPSR